MIWRSWSLSRLPGSQLWFIEAAVEISLAIVVALVVGGFGGRAHRSGVVDVAGPRRRPTHSRRVLVGPRLRGCDDDRRQRVRGRVRGWGRLPDRDGGQPSRSVEFADWIGVAGSYLVWLVFGVGFVGPVLAAGLDPVVLVYAVLSLTIVRMGPVALSMVRSPLRADTVALIGWFGPRGLASVVFLLVAFDQMGPTHPASLTLVHVVTWTVLMSIFLHGLSAGPIGALYGRRSGRGADRHVGDSGTGGAERAASADRPMTPTRGGGRRSRKGDRDSVRSRRRPHRQRRFTPRDHRGRRDRASYRASLAGWASRRERGLDGGRCRLDLLDRRLHRDELGAEARLIAESGQRGLECLDGGQQVGDSAGRQAHAPTQRGPERPTAPR